MSRPPATSSAWRDGRRRSRKESPKKRRQAAGGVCEQPVIDVLVVNVVSGQALAEAGQIHGHVFFDNAVPPRREDRNLGTLDRIAGVDGVDGIDLVLVGTTVSSAAPNAQAGVGLSRQPTCDP